MSDREPSPRRDIPRSAAVLLVAGMVAIFVSATLYVGENGDRSFAGDAPNYAPALLLLGVGAYLVLLAVIVMAGRRR